MEKIITLEDGRIFKISSNETLTPEQEHSTINQLKAKISKLATGCGITVTKGTSKNIKCTASGGTGRFLYELYMNGSKVASSPASSGGSYTFPYTFNTVGTINVSIKVIDDCSTPSTCNESNCTVTVTESSSTLSSIELTGCDAIHSVGGTCTITPICKDSSGTVITCPILTWVSESPSKITVSPTTNNKGLCTFVADGSSLITASASEVSGSKTVYVGVVCQAPVCNFTIE